MDTIDGKIAGLLQADSRLSSAEVGNRVGVSTSTANERIRRLGAGGVIRAWRAVLDPDRIGAGLCAMLFVDVSYAGEDAFRQAIAGMPEVQEAHHVSGPHSYLLKLRLADTKALQRFMQDKLKPLDGVGGTETLVVLDTVKETTELAFPEAGAD